MRSLKLVVVVGHMCVERQYATLLTHDPSQHLTGVSAGHVMPVGQRSMLGRHVPSLHLT